MLAIVEAEMGRRLAHLATILFTQVALVGVPLVLVMVPVSRLRPAAREWWGVGASLAFIGWLAGFEVAAAWIVGVLAVWLAVERVRSRALSTLLVVLILGVAIVLPVRQVGNLAAQGGYVREFVAFASNMALLRVWAYAWDRWQGAAALPLRSFLLANLFFPTVINGPIERPHAFAVGALAVDQAALRAAAARIVRGMGKMLLVGLALPPAWTTRLGGLGTMSFVELWGTAVLLWVWFYASFSAWSDLAIGMARACGWRMPENFDRPWRATDLGDFWHRWHVSLGRWLRDYVYVPLGGGRRRRARNVLLTFLVSALWHVWGTLKLVGIGYYPPAAWTGFLLWGALHAVAVVAAPRGPQAVAARPTWRARVALVGTFLFASFCWVPFFAPASVSPSVLMAALGHMLWPLSGGATP